MFQFQYLFFFNDTATTEIYTLSLHDALPICRLPWFGAQSWASSSQGPRGDDADRKSTRLNSSHVAISYAVFCLKKKKPKTPFRGRPLDESYDRSLPSHSALCLLSASKQDM